MSWNWSCKYFSHYLISSFKFAADEIMALVQHQFRKVKMDSKTTSSSKKKLMNFFEWLPPIRQNTNNKRAYKETWPYQNPTSASSPFTQLPGAPKSPLRSPPRWPRIPIVWCSLTRCWLAPVRDSGDMFTIHQLSICLHCVVACKLINTISLPLAGERRPYHAHQHTHTHTHTHTPKRLRHSYFTICTFVWYMFIYWCCYGSRALFLLLLMLVLQQDPLNTDAAVADVSTAAGPFK